jgi:hypothetical protein
MPGARPGSATRAADEAWRRGEHVSELMVSIQDKGGKTRSQTCRLRQALLAGYTGRDRAKVMEHIHELEKLGVTPPDRIPTIFVVPPDLITTDPALPVSGPETSG